MTELGIMVSDNLVSGDMVSDDTQLGIETCVCVNLSGETNVERHALYSLHPLQPTRTPSPNWASC